MSAALQAVADKRAIASIRRHIFLCCDQTNPKCCTKEQGLASWDYLKKRLDELNLTGAGGVYRTKANCFRICQGGPIAVVYPEAVWYSYVDASDIDEIVESHLKNGQVVERLLVPPTAGR